MGITFPVETPTELATQLVTPHGWADGDGHVTAGAVIDGRVDGTRGWGIEDDHAGRTRNVGAFVGLYAGFGGEMPLTAGGYTAAGDGVAVTDGVTISDVAPGVYRVALGRLVASEGTDLPAGFGLAVTPFTAATPPTWLVDSDPFTVTPPGSTVEGLATMVLEDFDPLHGTNRSTLVATTAPYLIVPSTCDALRLIPFTTVNIASFGATEVLITAGALEQVGDVPAGGI